MGIGVAVVLVGLAFMALRFKSRKREGSGGAREPPQELTGTTIKYRHDRGVSELGGNEVPSELETENREKGGLGARNGARLEHERQRERAELA